MTGWALLETQAFALDVDGFRTRFGISEEMMSDEDLLRILHERRAESKFIPDDACEESKQWLKEHSRKKKATTEE